MRRQKKILSRYIFIVFSMLFLLLVNGQSVYANDGVIRINLDGTGISGGDTAGVIFYLYRVGTVAEDTDVPGFYQEYGISTYPRTAEELEAAIVILQGKLPGQPERSGVTGSDGIVEFSGVERGVYYVAAAEDNPYGIVMPFILQIPYYEQANGQLTGPGWQIEMIPKAEPYQQETQKPRESENPQESSSPGQSEEREAQDAPEGDINTISRKVGQTDSVYCPDIRIKYEEPAKTGDAAEIVLYFCGALLALFVLAGAVMGRKQYEE